MAAKSTEHIYPPVWVEGEAKDGTTSWKKVKWDSLTPEQKKRMKLINRYGTLCYVVLKGIEG